jgi:hypothetical protein
MTMNRYKDASTYADGYKQVGAVLFEYESDIKVVVCFAVSYKVQCIKVICGEGESLESICKDLDAATSHQHSIQNRAVHDIQSTCGASNVQVQAKLDSEKIMGEEVWVIQLMLVRTRQISLLMKSSQGDSSGKNCSTVWTVKRQEWEAVQQA